jgi:hypothetical protein
MDFEADAQRLKVNAPDEEKLKRLSELATIQVNLEQEIADTANHLKNLGEQLRSLSEITIPDLMKEIGMEEFKLTDGTKVVVKPYYAANIKEENQQAAFDWLKESGHDDIIKNEFKVNFGRGEEALAQQLRDYLALHKMIYTLKAGVHPQTLKAFVREQVESGTGDFPMETFSVYIGSQAKIKLPKKK